MYKITSVLLAAFLLSLGACQDSTPDADNQTPPNDSDDQGLGRDAEEQDTDEVVTRSLFNGTDLAGWHSDVPAADDNAEVSPSFVTREGMQVVSLGSPGGHLITDDIYENYRLEVEYRFANNPGNCGVLVHASTPRALYGMFPSSVEVQMNSGHAGDFWCIIENIEVDDMASRRNGDPSTWSGQEGDSRRILNLTDDSENEVGEWNTMVIESLGNTIRVWVNGDLVNNGYNMTASQGQIALQAEGVEVEFRKVDLTPITELTAVDEAISE